MQEHAAPPSAQPTPSHSQQQKELPASMDHAADSHGGAQGNPHQGRAVMASDHGTTPAAASSMDAQSNPSPSAKAAQTSHAGTGPASESGPGPLGATGQAPLSSTRGEVASTKREPEDEANEHASVDQEHLTDHVAASDHTMHDVDMVTDSQGRGGSKRQQEFAFRPTRPRTKGLHRPRALVGLSASGHDEVMPPMGHGTSTSGLDSLACAAAWELGDEDAPAHDMVGHNSSGRHTSPRPESEPGHGDYLYDEEGMDGDQDHDYDEGEGEEDQDGELSPYGTGAAAQTGGTGAGRGAGGGRRPCPRRGGAPRPRDPAAEAASEEAGLVYAATSGRPDLDACPPDVFEADLVGFLTARGDRQLAAHVREKRITCNSLPLDIYGLYREVVKRGGYVANERYDDKGSRWTGTINFAGDIFPRLRNWTANNRATSVGSQLLNNYRKFLLAYERAYARWDLPNTDLAQQQRQAALAFGTDASAAATAIVAASINTNAKRSQGYDAHADVNLLSSSGAMGLPAGMSAPASRRSSASGAGYAGSKRAAAAAAAAATSGPADAGWQQAAMTDRVESGYDDESSRMHGGGQAGGRSTSWAGLDTSGAVEPGLGSAGAQGMTSTHTGTKRRRQVSASADGTPMSVLPLSRVVSPAQPGVRRVQQLQQQWGTAQMNLYMTGQQWWRPGQIVLVQDPHQPALQWALMVADLTDLPLEVADGGRIPAAPAHLPMSLPLKVMEASPQSKLEDVTPVLLLGTTAMGWVDRLACRPFNPTTLQAAMSSVLHRLPGGSEQELACMRGLKIGMELSIHNDAGAHSGGVTPAAYAGVSAQHVTELITCMQSASIQHAAKRLLDLEGAIARSAVASQSIVYWSSWRESVNNASTAAALTFPLLALCHQLRPGCLTTPQEALLPELLTLLGLSPPMGHVSGADNTAMLMPFPDATCLGVDMAVGLLHASIDWMAMKRAWHEVLTGNPSPLVGGMTTPLATPAGPWSSAGLPTPQGLTATPMGNNPINVVDRSARVMGGVQDGTRRPLPPVGPTAPPSTTHVGASFSSRMSTQLGAGGLPPRPPPVRVGSMSGAPTPGPHGLSPTAQQVQGGAPSLSPLRVVPGPTNLTAVDTKPVDLGVVHMGAAPVQPGSARAGGNRADSPQPGAGDGAQAAGNGQAGATGGSGTPLASPNMQPGALVFGTAQPAQQMSSSNAPLPPPLALDAVPLDLSAPATQHPSSTSNQVAFGTSGLGSNGFGVGAMGSVVMGVSQPGGSLGMGVNLMSPGSQNNQAPRALQLAAGQDPPQGSLVLKTSGGSGITSPPAGASNATVLTTPNGAVPAQQPIVVRDQSTGVAGEGGGVGMDGRMMNGGMHWGGLNSMDNNSMLSPQHHMMQQQQQHMMMMMHQQQFMQMNNHPGQAAGMRMPPPGPVNNSQVSR